MYDRQKDLIVIKFIDKYITEHNCSPLFIEIAQATGISNGAIYKRLVRLRNENLVDFTTERRSLTITQRGRAFFIASDQGLKM